jgi:hypothetical protein
MMGSQERLDPPTQIIHRGRIAHVVNTLFKMAHFSLLSIPDLVKARAIVEMLRRKSAADLKV